MIREQIIEKSSDLFFTLGFKTLTMDDIAKDLSVSKKTLYQHFGSKENLISAVLAYNFQDLEGNFKQIQEQEYNALEELIKLNRYVDDKCLVLHNHECIVELQKYYGKLYNKVYLTQYHKILKVLESNIEKGLSQKLYRDDLEANIVSALYLNIINFINTFGIEQTYNYDFNYKMAQSFKDIFIRGFLTEKGHKLYAKIN